MIYCMSDIHGERDRYLAMLKLIHFSDKDILYILGDVIDRKPDGIEILRDIIDQPNINMIKGNHEQMMLNTFGPVPDYDAKRLWHYNGGGITYRKMRYCYPEEERIRILRFAQQLPDCLDIEVNGRKFHLVHGYPANDPYRRIWGRPDHPIEEPPIPGVTTIIGHTCTYFLYSTKDQPFKIWHAPGLIAIDCGCGNSTPLRQLACLRLDDLKEFYI